MLIRGERNYMEGLLFPWGTHVMPWGHLGLSVTKTEKLKCQEPCGQHYEMGPVR